DDRAARIGGSGAGPVGIAALGPVHVARHRRLRQPVLVADIVPALAQRRRLPDQVSAEVPFVGTAPTDRVDDTAVGTAVLRAVATGIGLLLLDGAIRHGQAAQSLQRIGGVETVDVVRVLAGRRTAEADQGLAGGAAEAAAVADHAGCQQGNRLRVAAER